MREAYLVGAEEPAPGFVRKRPLTERELELLRHQPEAHTFYECQKHGVFAVPAAAGLVSASCPKGRQCRHVQEVPDPAGYAERHHRDRYQLTPEQNAQLDAVLALPGRGLSEDELRAEMERILGCQVKGSAQQMLDAFREGLAGLDLVQEQPVQEPARPASQPRAEAAGDEPAGDEQPEEDAGAMPEMTEVETYASLLFGPAEVCLVLGLDYDEQRDSPDFQRQMQRGRLIQEAKVRGSIFLSARIGSAPAQTEALKIIARENIARAARYE